MQFWEKQSIKKLHVCLRERNRCDVILAQRVFSSYSDMIEF